MSVIKGLSPPIVRSPIARPEQAEPAAIGRILDVGFVDPGIRALRQVPRIAGRR